MYPLAGKVVLLTGGSRGVGPIIAESLARKGANLVLAARSRSGLDKVASSLRKLGVKAMMIPVDLSKSSQRQRLIEITLKQFSNIDILVNNAGLETEGAYTDLAWDAICQTIEVNLVAPMELTRLALPRMLKRRSGHIVNMASIAAKSGAPYAAVYSGTKAGLAEWTRALRLELRNSGVGFTTIFPGYVRDVGMFAKFGIRSPWIVGSCSPMQVAGAVVSAIERGRAERIINTPPLRYSFILNEAFPSVGDWLMRVSGLTDFQKRKVGK
jgi:short-subunit dehydrogenase